MPQTFREYPIRTVAICTQDFAPHTNGTKERSLCGDITVIKTPWGQDHGTIGSSEATQWLWFQLEGLDKNEMGYLSGVNRVPFDPADDGVHINYDKRRYCIPLERLKKLYPALDIAKAKDATVAYQPFVMTQGDPPYYFLKKPKVFDVQGLVFDKAIGRYL